MKKYNQLIKKAKFFFDSNQFEDAHNCLLDVLKRFELDLKIKSNLYLLLADINKNALFMEMNTSGMMESKPHGMN